MIKSEVYDVEETTCIWNVKMLANISFIWTCHICKDTSNTMVSLIIQTFWPPLTCIGHVYGTLNVRSPPVNVHMSLILCWTMQEFFYNLTQHWSLHKSPFWFRNLKPTSTFSFIEQHYYLKLIDATHGNSHHPLLDTCDIVWWFLFVWMLVLAISFVLTTRVNINTWLWVARSWLVPGVFTYYL